MTYFFQIQNFNGCQKGPFKDSQTEIRNKKLEQNISAFDIFGNNFLLLRSELTWAKE